jgi:CheY-like chemotaxis protein
MAYIPTTSVLLIDGNNTNRIGFANHLRSCSPDYQILEATDGEEGLALYRSQRVDCVVLALELPDRSGFQVLVELVPIASRPSIAVLVLTNRTQRRLHELARQNGAYACFVKKFTSGDDLERAILRAMAFVGRMPKDDQYLAV